MAERSSGGYPKPRLLIIDDDELVRATLCDILEEAGFEVVETADGQQGLEAISSAPFDLVITDIFMPEKEGIETILELRRRHVEVPIIAISGGGSTQNLEFLKFAGWLGADRILTKPIVRDQLVRTVLQALAAGTRQASDAAQPMDHATRSSNAGRG